MNSRTTASFRKALQKLPSQVRQQAREAYRRFKENPYHPGLRFKQVHPTMPIYSARVSRDYRALGVREADTMIWFWIGTHAEYDHMIAQL